MRDPRLAFYINCIWPGCGFIYVDRYGLAILNFGLFLSAGFVIQYSLGEFYDLLNFFAAFPVLVASGYWAEYVAIKTVMSRRNATRRSNLGCVGGYEPPRRPGLPREAGPRM